jgi:SAM-dependent methyltransferase
MPGIDGNIAVEHLHRYALAAALVSGKSVLDIASGEGYGSRLLASVAADVTGVDVAETAIAHARMAYQAANLRFLQGDCCNIPTPAASFDAVVSFETLEHVHEHDRVYAELKRVLKPGGILVISCPEKKTYSDAPGYSNPFHARELYLEEFIKLNQSYFTHCSFMQQKIVHGSAICPIDAPVGSCGFLGATGGLDGIHLSGRLEGAMYNIAMCCDAAIPVPLVSIFQGRGIKTDIEAALSALQSQGVRSR